MLSASALFALADTLAGYADEDALANAEEHISATVDKFNSAVAARLDEYGVQLTLDTDLPEKDQVGLHLVVQEGLGDNDGKILAAIDDVFEKVNEAAGHFGIDLNLSRNSESDAFLV